MELPRQSIVIAVFSASLEVCVARVQKSAQTTSTELGEFSQGECTHASGAINMQAIRTCGDRCCSV